jgi:hypothetical protein
MPRDLRATVFKIDRKGRTAGTFGAYQLHRETGGYEAGFGTEREVKDTREAARDAYVSGRQSRVVIGARRALAITEFADIYLDSRSISSRRRGRRPASTFAPRHGRSVEAASATFQHGR